MCAGCKPCQGGGRCRQSWCAVPPSCRLPEPAPRPTRIAHPVCLLRAPACVQFGGEVLLEALVNSSVDIRDAAAISLLTEVAQSLQLVHSRCGEQYLGYLCSTLLPRMGWPPQAAQQLVAHITGSDTKTLKDFLKAALQQIKQQQQQQRQQQQQQQQQAAANGAPR